MNLIVFHCNFKFCSNIRKTTKLWNSTKFKEFTWNSIVFQCFLFESLKNNWISYNFIEYIMNFIECHLNLFEFLSFVVFRKVSLARPALSATLDFQRAEPISKYTGDLSKGYQNSLKKHNKRIPFWPIWTQGPFGRFRSSKTWN